MLLFDFIISAVDVATLRHNEAYEMSGLGRDRAFKQKILLHKFWWDLRRYKIASKGWGYLSPLWTHTFPTFAQIFIFFLEFVVQKVDFLFFFILSVNSRIFLPVVSAHTLLVLGVSSHSVTDLCWRSSNPIQIVTQSFLTQPDLSQHLPSRWQHLDLTHQLWV